MSPVRPLNTSSVFLYNYVWLFKMEIDYSIKFGGLTG